MQCSLTSALGTRVLLHTGALLGRSNEKYLIKCIRKNDMSHLCLILASLALEGVISQIGDGNQSTEIANMNSIGIGDLKKTFAQKLSSSMRNLTITLHLTETKTTITSTTLKNAVKNCSNKTLNYFTFHRLPNENLNRSTSS